MNALATANCNTFIKIEYNHLSCLDGIKSTSIAILFAEQPKIKLFKRNNFVHYISMGVQQIVVCLYSTVTLSIK